jgi:hypothetical protein
MKKLAVHYCGWGEDWLLGLLADDGTTLLFEYLPEALTQRLELSPRTSSCALKSTGVFRSTCIACRG